MPALTDCLVPRRLARAAAFALVTVLVVPLAAAQAAAQPPASDRWRLPLVGQPVVARPFQPPPTRYGAGHRGVDLRGTAGAPVLAAGDGVIGYAGLLAGRGVVTVVHGPLRTTYEPVAASVQRGQRVAAGAVIGTLVAGGHCPPGACLHWGLLRGEDYLDPLLLLRRGPSRLLPVWPMAPAPAGERQLAAARSVVQVASPPVASPVTAEKESRRSSPTGPAAVALVATTAAGAGLLATRARTRSR